MIYGIVGEIGAGKTWCSTEIVKQLKYDGNSVLVIAWADPVKQIIQDSFQLFKSGPGDVQSCIDEYHTCDHYYDAFDYFRQNLHHRLTLLCEEAEISFDQYGWENAWDMHGASIHDAIRACWIKKDYSNNYRTIIQLVGTEFGRRVNDNLWIQVVLDRINIALEGNVCQAVIIDDTRFPNEYDAIVSSGIPYKFQAVLAPLSVRAQRISTSEDDLLDFSKHDSERFIPDLIQRIPKSQHIINM